ncbi:TonB-dependent receptor [Sphingomonas sp. SRS2]|uniref:TonB-dependent receptor n=1 Tax=Sphingomonas sp. SRS2 TaxID=133190 RepID=UPI0006184AE3|nr:TonB-dependent receptor [Sphingomonas sp. SRS2]KKC23923.1 hypothetical protein WP12_22170 [Sphingomonas sp. SRS2]
MAISLSNGAFAQETGTAGPAVSSEDAAGEKPFGLEEIVVTAQKRSENVQKVPLAISVVSADALRTGGALTAADLSKSVPSLQTYVNGPFAQLSIRGIGSSQINAFSDPAVSFVLDGVVQDRAANATASFYDINRIEVLKGPQGTLFGRNATAGALNIVTNEPSFAAVEGNAEIEVGNYRTFNTTGAINLPVTDSLAVRGAWQTTKHDGYFTNGYNDADNVAGRLKALWKPSDDITIHIQGDYFRQKGLGYADAILPLGSNGQGGDDPWDQDYYPVDGFVDNRIWGIQGQLDWDLGPATLTVIPGYRDTRQESYYHYAGSWSFVDNPTQQTTMEVRLGRSGSGAAGSLTWVAGLYYFKLSQDAFNQYELQCFCANDAILDYNTSPNYTGRDLSDLDTKSYAAFGQATYAITDHLRATGGLRYTRDRKTELGISIVELPTIGVSLTAPNIAQRTFKNLSWKAAVDADIGPQSLAYASVSTGYKAGGLNEGLNSPGYGPEKLMAFALGSKNRFFDRRVQLNIEAFYWRYRNKQIATVASVPPPGNLGYFGSNIPRSKIYGLDIDGVVLVTDHDQIDFAIEYLHSSTSPFVVPTTGAPFVSDGTRVLRTPRWNIAAGFVHTFEMANGANVKASIRTNYRSRQLLDVYEAPTDFAPSSMTTDVNIGYNAPDNRWHLDAFVRNIENEAVIVGVFRPYIPGPRSSVGWGFLGAPRTYGVKLGVNF